MSGGQFAIVPAGFHVEAADGMLWYSADPGRFPGQLGNYRVGRSGTYVRENFDAHGQTDEERIAGVAAQALDELQDYIDEATHDPWPGERTPPRAHAQIRGQMLHLWYGGREISSDAVLACEPIPMGQTGAGPQDHPPHLGHIWPDSDESTRAAVDAVLSAYQTEQRQNSAAPDNETAGQSS